MTDDVKQRRKVQVQILRKCAKTCQVSQARDDAKRERVQEMAQAIAASSGPEQSKSDAAAAFEIYESTFADAQAADGQQPPRNGFRLRGKSFLLTYNWDFLHRPLPDGTAPLAGNKEVWQLWKEWKTLAKKELVVVHSTSKLEQSLNSDTPDRVHLHWKIDLKTALDQTTTDNFAFHGIRPQVETTMVDFAKKARGGNAQMASNRGHFYCWAPKLGSLSRGSNWRPFRDYRVYGPWIEDLWTQRKLDHETYRELSRDVRVGHVNRKRDLEQVVAEEREARIDAKIIEVNSVLATITAPFRTFPEVRAFEDQFLHVDFRYKMLALVADSASGKSLFGESLFERPYIITVEDATNLDLKDLDPEKNDGILLDNVNSWQQILKWRAILQARNAKSRGGQSATNMFSYPQYLYGMAIVVTVDLDAPDGHLVDPEAESYGKKASGWLLKNCIFIKLKAGEAFFEKDKVPTLKVENRFSLFAETIKRRRLTSP